MPLTDPVPSSAFDVLERNIQDTDKFVNQEAGTFTNRVGKEIKPIQVIEAEANAAVNTVITEITSLGLQAIESIGWYPVGEFATGFTYTKLNDVGRDASGSWWRYNGSDLPKVITAGTVPSSPNFSVISFETADNVQWKVGKSAGYSLDDLQGFTDELYAQSGTTPSGLPDEIGNSQRANALHKIFLGQATLAQVSEGRLPVGASVSITDRSFGIFDIKDDDGYVVNNLDVIPAGDGKVAVLPHTNTSWISVKWLGATGTLVDGDNSPAINRAFEMTRNVYAPDGNYLINNHLRMRYPEQRFIGAGREVVRITAQSIPTVTIGGSTGRAMLWYQDDLAWNAPTWIKGGAIQGITFDANNGETECIRINRVCISQVFDKIKLVNCTQGIYGTKFGWLTQFNNVIVESASICSIQLVEAWNGCTFSGCLLYGKTLTTQVHLLMNGDCYGNSWRGGAIEKCDVAVRLIHAQLDVSGADFEVITDRFVEIIGKYDGESLISAAPTSRICGNSFVGVTRLDTINVKGGTAEVTGNFFIANATPDPAVYLMNGEAAGDQTVSGFMQPCIYESNNTSRGWSNDRYSKGAVFTRHTSVAAGSSTFKKIQIGDATSKLPDNSSYNTNLVGKAKIPQSFNCASPSFNSDTLLSSYKLLADYQTYDSQGEQGYVANQYNLSSAALNMYANFQSETTYGKASITASATRLDGTVNTVHGLWIDSLTASIRPGADNTLTLGTAAYRFGQIYSSSGSINTSDIRLKLIKGIDDEVLNAWGDVRAVSFKWLDAIEEKGESARIHFGYGAQQIAEAFESHGLNAFDYGLLCYDKWEDEDPVVNEKGELISQGINAGDKWGVRYSECQILESAYIRREISKLINN